MSSGEMQSFHISRIAVLAIFLAGSVHGSSESIANLTLTVGEYFEAGVITLFDVVERCYITTPSMKNVTFKPDDESDDKYEILEGSDVVGCRVRVQKLEEEDTGIWTLNTVSTTGTRRSNSYNITVNPSAESDITDETTPTPQVNVINLDEIRFDTELGATHRIEIPVHDFINTQNCFIVTPEDNRINLETQEVSGIELINDRNVACGVIINIKEESQIGQWFLISRETRLTSDLYERRLPFTVHVTEEVNAIPNEINIVEDKNFYVRLENAITNPETCKLLNPDGSEYSNFEIDARYIDTCGFIVRSVNKEYNGTWRIEHGNRITYRAPFEVTVHSNGAQGQDQNQVLVWTRDQPVQETIGSEDAIYCKVVDPKDLVIFEGFGRCSIYLPRASDEHEGIWKMFVGIRGRVLTEESSFRVQLVDGSPKPTVRTNVTSNKPIVTLSCSVSSPYPISACKFRDPSGRILMANPGVGEDRYTFHGQESSYESGVYAHDCGIQITNPLIRDLGIWRCALETDEDTYFGFVTVWCPWATRDPEVAASVVKEPTLTADRPLLEVIEGDDVLMSCSVQSAIRYCYFRTSNGTVYNVGPGFSSSDMAEYAGAGLDAGECSIRFRSLNEGDSRGWSCHVGFPNINMSEQRANFDVNVTAIMAVTQTEESIRIVVEGGRPLDYCRFVRIDGLGFTNDAVPEPYLVQASLAAGQCTLFTFNPTMLDRHPWTVVARITGHADEITKTTPGTLVLPPTPPPPPPGLETQPLQTLWLVFMVSGLVLIMLGILIIPKRNRNWTYSKASSIRNSFRHRFAKKAAVDANINQKNTANAA